MSTATAPRYYRLTTMIAEPSTRVDREAGIIRRFAVITRGEASGHGMWIDAEFLAAVAAAGNAAEKGVKARFTHPGLSGDGLGKFLGRAENFVVEGDRVLADLRLSDTAKASPDGDLATYVLDLAEREPDMFGASIVYLPNATDELAYEAEHDDGEGFVSPDPENVRNYPHARLAKLRAVDLVDEPAANPAGMFHDGEEMAARAEAALSFLYGLTDTPDPMALGGVDPQRARLFRDEFLARHGLTITPATNREPAPEPEGEIMSEETRQEEIAAATAAAREEATAEATARLSALQTAFPDRPQFVLDQFAAGHDVTEAKAALADILLAEIANPPAPVAPDSASESAGADPVRFSGENQPEDTIALAEKIAAEKGVTFAEALKTAALKSSTLRDEVCAGLRIRLD